MSTKAQVQAQAKTPPVPAATHVAQLPVAVPDREADRPNIATQLEGAARLGHSLEGFSVDGSAPPLVQRQELPEEEELQMQREPSAVQRQETPKEEEELQTKPDTPGMGLEGGPVAPDVEAAIQRARGGGQPLDGAIQAQMGERLGHDFSTVRVHADGEADALNQRLSARAFATGRDVFFRRDEYNPGSKGGRKLLAHELTHVLQQNAGRVCRGGNGMTVRSAEDALEYEADSGSSAVAGSIPTAIQRTNEKEDDEERILPTLAPLPPKPRLPPRPRTAPLPLKPPSAAIKATKEAPTSAAGGPARTAKVTAAASPKPMPTPPAGAAGPGPTRMQRGAVKIIDPYSEETPTTIWDAYREASESQQQWDRAKRLHEDTKHQPENRRAPMPSGPRPGAPIPWLAVKDLYAAATFTGDQSWEPLVRRRHGAGGADQASRFTVFTGMHGNLGGQFVDSEGKIKEKYKDREHTGEDMAMAAKLGSELGCDIEVIDVFETDDLRKPERLRDAAKERIAAGRVVILAWCYSMEGFKAVPEGIAEGEPEKAYLQERTLEKIKDIIADVFGEDLSGYERPRVER